MICYIWQVIFISPWGYMFDLLISLSICFGFYFYSFHDEYQFIVPIYMALCIFSDFLILLFIQFNLVHEVEKQFPKFSFQILITQIIVTSFLGIGGKYWALIFYLWHLLSFYWSLYYLKKYLDYHRTKA
jgi:hypothetical protein